MLFNSVQATICIQFRPNLAKRGIGPKISLAPPRAAQNQMKNAAPLSPALFFTGIVEIMAVWVSVFQQEQPIWSEPAKLGSFWGPEAQGGLTLAKNLNVKLLLFTAAIAVLLLLLTIRTLFSP